MTDSFLKGKFPFFLKKPRAGFTLIEILVVMGIFGILAVFGTQMLFSIMKGSIKSRSLTVVKENGEYVINMMERAIRDAQTVFCLSGGAIKAISLDGEIEFFACNAPVAGAIGYRDKLLTNYQYQGGGFQLFNQLHYEPGWD
jgi:prepilin-type N-terminal cleavage/methylation domain-containing protein